MGLIIQKKVVYGYLELPLALNWIKTNHGFGFLTSSPPENSFIGMIFIWNEPQKNGFPSRHTIRDVVMFQREKFVLYLMF